MEKEVFLSGYCRCIDASFMICAVLDDGELTEVDCNMGSCPYESECTLAKNVHALLEE
jgi:hypothetical protein